MSKGTSQERQPFDVAWRTIDGLKVRYATSGKGERKSCSSALGPRAFFAFAPVWEGLTKHLEVLALDLPGFGRSEGARRSIRAAEDGGVHREGDLRRLALRLSMALDWTLEHPRCFSHHWHDHRYFVALSWVPAPRHTHSSLREF